MKVGDILVFNWLCAHFSKKKNNSQKSRMIMYLTFCPKEKGNTVIRNKYYFDKENVFKQIPKQIFTINYSFFLILKYWFI